jgi:hypothetical protein
MQAKTLPVRNIIRQAIAQVGATESFSKHTYTEKTTPKYPNRRSVVFSTFSGINGRVNAEAVAKKTKAILAKNGYTNRVTVTACTGFYVRVIADIS